MPNMNLCALKSSLLIAGFAASVPVLLSQNNRPLRVDETKLYQLVGNTRSEANSQNDRGRVPDDFGMEHMMLQLHRSAEREQALTRFVDSLHDPKSPTFHKW